MTQQEIDNRIKDYQEAIKANQTTKEFGEMMIGFLKQRKPMPYKPEKKRTPQQKKEILALFGR